MIFTILLTLWNSEQKNRPLIKLFCFSSDFDATCWSWSTYCVLQLHQVWLKSDEKQESFINSPFFCLEFHFKVSVDSWKSYIVQMSYKWKRSAMKIVCDTGGWVQRLKSMSFEIFLHSAATLRPFQKVSIHWGKHPRPKKHFF